MGRDTADTRAKRFQTIQKYEASWVNEVDSATLRHSKCFEIGELWAHHLAEPAKLSTVSDVPSVPVYDKSKADDKLYVESASCQTGHAMVAGGGSDSGNADMEVWWS